MKVQAPAPGMQGGQSRMPGGCPALSFFLIALRQGFSLNLELDWLPASPSDPPVCTPNSTGGAHASRTQLFTTWLLGSKLRSTSMQWVLLPAQGEFFIRDSQLWEPKNPYMVQMLRKIPACVRACVDVCDVLRKESISRAASFSGLEASSSLKPLSIDFPQCSSGCILSRRVENLV